MTLETSTVEVARTRVKAIWSSGDFGKIAESIQSHADAFVANLPVKSDSLVLDLACGTGNIALAAARRDAIVSGIDIAPNLVQTARTRAAANGFDIEFQEGDAEMLPYPDATFDMVISMYGVMFAAHPELAAAEMLRVCAPGGIIALANWTPAGFIGQMLKTISAHVPPPPGLTSPILWGVEATVRERLGYATTAINCTPRQVVFEYPFSPVETVDLYLQYYGPTLRAYAACSSEKQVLLRRDLENLWSAHNQATNGTTRVISEYLEVVAIRA